MTQHYETRELPYTPAQVFALVADVEKYPEFLPWCRAARILERGENEFTAELVISFKGFAESYVSRVTLEEPRRIDVHMISGPFTHLENNWVFSEAPGGGTRIDFALDFQFRSRMLGGLIGALFGSASKKMVAAFTSRAARLYGGEDAHVLER